MPFQWRVQNNQRNGPIAVPRCRQMRLEHADLQVNVNLPPRQNDVNPSPCTKDDLPIPSSNSDEQINAITTTLTERGLDKPVSTAVIDLDNSISNEVLPVFDVNKGGGMDYDEVLEQVGDLGPYQKRLLVIALLPIIYNAFGQSMNNFVLGNHLYRCKIPWYPNDTYALQSDVHAQIVNESIPLTDDDDYDECHIIINGTEEKCKDWVFDESVFTRTANSQFKTVCDEEIMANHATMMYYFGAMVACVIMNPMADLLGRRMVACVSCTLQFIANIAMPFSVDIYMFAALRFVDGFFSQAIYPTVFVIVLEMVGPSKRYIPATLILMAFCVGNFVLVGLGYFIRDWRWLQLALGAPMVISVFYWWKAVLPESPRWLISRGRTEEAMKIIQKMAKVNKKELYEDIKTIKVEDENDEGLIVIMKSLFQSRTLIVRWIIVLINWFVISFIYYGVTLNISFLGEDLYLTFFINAIVETLGYCLQFFINKTGRRKMYLTTMFSMGVFFVASVFTDLYIDSDSDLSWITVALTMVGKMLISLVYGIIYVFTGELFPTVVRGGVLGVCAFSASIGSLITPYLYELGVEGQLQTTLPLILYAGTTIVAAMSSCFLPETTNMKLQEKVKDAQVEKESLLDEETKYQSIKLSQ